ncbi:uncharacterized protein PAC_01599 [Phialocephala subalpina]|uniref:Uncharacterized protein n=1 Tax=Phialocephala subalpina TaxID=576137 RepID=A0A1L7WG21_9HELO|nr:uncharacterized protein PAC_01599 [Phialocephala subalpina]
MSMQMVLWKHSGASKMAVEPRKNISPSGEHKPKLTMTRGGVLRSTRAGEGSRKAAIVKYALDHLVRHSKGGDIQSYIIDCSLSVTESKMVLVGMSESQLLEWAEMPNPEKAWGENRSTMLHSHHLVGYYYREPGLSLTGRTGEGLAAPRTLEDICEDNEDGGDQNSLFPNAVKLAELLKVQELRSTIKFSLIL